MSSKSPKVEGYLRQAKKWQAEMRTLRTILLDFPLTEELKWGKPCYAFEGSNVVIIQPFNEYCALLFFKGALLKDADGILVKPGENTQAGRQARFTSLRDIVAMELVLKSYLREAIEAAKSGSKVKLKKTADFIIPDELQAAFEEHPGLKAAFEALTPGRQRAYILYFAAAKQSKTRAARIEKCTPPILEGKGLND